MNNSSRSKRNQPKSKSGCKTCKRRKVKCGEERPACKNCIKYAVKCDFLPLVGTHSSPHSNFDGPIDGTNSDGNEGVLEPLAMQDLELFHHWCFFTYSTITKDPKLQEIWRVQATQLAFSRTFVMRSILALTALHIASLRPDRRDDYLLLAMDHHHDALSTARVWLTDAQPEDTPALWMFTALTLIFKMGSPNSATELITPDADGLFQWVYLLRGVQSVMRVGQRALKTSPVGPLFKAAQEKSKWRKHSTSQEVHLTQLCGRIQGTSHPLKDTFLFVIEELRQMYAGAACTATGTYHFNPGPHEMTDCFIWPFFLADEYLEALQRKCPEALAILAHFCVLLKVWDHECWWLSGSSDQLMSAIWNSLDADHRRWIEWPVLQTQWLPSNSSELF